MPDSTPPSLSQVTAVASPANDTTPNYTFSSTEAGTISYGGDCSSATTSAAAGNNTITFNELSAGVHSNCTITVTDASTNASSPLAVNTFTIDITAPTLSQITPVSSPTNDATPNYTFSSTETGTISYGGDCSSGITAAGAGNNTLTFNTLAAGTYSTCTVSVTDNAGNISSALAVTSFTIDLTAPALSQVTPVSSPTNDATPSYTFSSDESGLINYTGDCSSGTSSAGVGGNTITFNTLSEGLHSNCGITVTDNAGNVSSVLSVSGFTIDLTQPAVTISSDTSNPTNSNPIPISITFSESVTGFTLSDITVSNGSASNFAGSGSSYSADITPAGSRLAVRVNIADSIAADAAGNSNTAAVEFLRGYGYSRRVIVTQ